MVIDRMPELGRMELLLFIVTIGMRDVIERIKMPTGFASVHEPQRDRTTG